MSEADSSSLFDEVNENHPSPRPRVSEADAGLLAALIQRSRLYQSGPDYVALLRFINRMRHMAPFNATLLHMQKPGLQFAATDVDWFKRFGRTVKEGARPLVIMWPFSPVALVYDVEDTEGPDLPADVAEPFRAQGDMTEARLHELIDRLRSSAIECQFIDYGQSLAGHIRVAVSGRWKNKKGKDQFAYRIRVNAAHEPNVQFATLAHELGHLFLGHLGGDERLNIKKRFGLGHSIEELEAEMVAYLVCERQGVLSVSEPYLANFINEQHAVDYVVHHGIAGIAQAAGRVEQSLGIAAVIDVGVDRKGRPTVRPMEHAPQDHDLE